MENVTLLNRKQLSGLIRLECDNASEIVQDLNSFKVEDFISINLSKTREFDNYPLAYSHCYDTFFKGKDENSLSSELYVQYSFTEQPKEKSISSEDLLASGSSPKARYRRIQKGSASYIPEADDETYTELTDECPPSVKKLIDEITATGDTVTRVRLAGLAPHHSILLHRDHDPTKLIRLHIPVKTNDKCVIDCENKSLEIVTTHLESGGLYMLNTGRRHAARNESDEWRVHLLIDVHGQNFINKCAFGAVVD